MESLAHPCITYTLLPKIFVNMKIFVTKITNIPGRLPKSMIGIERIEDTEKNDFCTKTFFKSDLFCWHFVVEHNVLLFLRERLQGLLSIPISIRDGN